VCHANHSTMGPPEVAVPVLKANKRKWKRVAKHGIPVRMLMAFVVGCRCGCKPRILNPTRLRLDPIPARIHSRPGFERHRPAPIQVLLMNICRSRAVNPQLFQKRKDRSSNPRKPARSHSVNTSTIRPLADSFSLPRKSPRNLIRFF